MQSKLLAFKLQRITHWHSYEQTNLILFLSLGLIGTAFADNIGKLKSSNACEMCNVKGASLSREDLSGAILIGADLSEAILCNTKMSNGDIDNSGC